MGTKKDLITALNSLEMFADTLPIGASAMLMPYIQRLRQEIHQTTAENVEDKRLRPKPRCMFCGEEIERAPHDFEPCVRTLIVQIRDQQVDDR